MESNILEEVKRLNCYDLNFSVDNFQIFIYNFIINTYKRTEERSTEQHSCYELHYVRNGSGHISMNQTHYALQRGCLYLISPRTPYRLTGVNKSMTEYVLHFNIHRLDENSTHQTMDEESRQLIELLTLTANQVFLNQFYVESLFEKCFNEVTDKKPGYYLTLKQQIMSIIINAARLSFSKTVFSQPYTLPTHTETMDQMDVINDYIYNHITSGITNAAIAEHIHLSERQLQRLVKEQAGMTPHQYVTTLRINMVKTLLDTHRYTLKTISEMTGFSSEFHLSSTFKKYTKMTPTDYMKHKNPQII